MCIVLAIGQYKYKHLCRYIDPIDFVNSLNLKHNEQQVLQCIVCVCMYTCKCVFVNNSNISRMHKSLEIYFLAG